ncbi:helix-turn-helix domain-containing protein [Desulfoferrobacter suflitae]|uniref:helix-turn-helix domain-containing protein n=1 Tax=Desulfoferrobacter suflitae TaxID=2865782 RepID=UPI002164B999|nr:helix-turn-helix domain-containing protein [Desulfoferrobacter suflitae]MCK8600498.1 helix-turn-helix domain-containing protein [Desulfoferrobacter suflitae]
MNGDFELVRGSGNVLRDFGRKRASIEQARAILAARIIRTFGERGSSTWAAEKLTGVAHSEFSPIRNPRVGRFTLDRTITILDKFDQLVHVSSHNEVAISKIHSPGCVNGRRAGSL